MVDTWFPTWLREHLERLQRRDFPNPTSNFWDPLKEKFIRLGVLPTLAREASVRMCIDPPEHVGSHHREFLKLVDNVTSEQQPGIVADDRSVAWSLSVNCFWCEGNGLAQVQLATGENLAIKTSSGLETTWPTLVVLCSCPMGRWISPRSVWKWSQLEELLLKGIPLVKASAGPFHFTKPAEVEQKTFAEVFQPF